MIVREIDILPGDVTGVPGDIHFDKEDKAALRIMCDVFRAFRVNNGILIGDTFDSIGISRHPRLARDFRFGKGTIASERRHAEPWLEEIAAIVASNRDTGRRSRGLHALTGNHEFWSSKMADDYPGLLDSPWSEYYGDLFDGWHVWAEATALRLGSLLVCHGHRLRGSLNRNSAVSVLQNYPGQNTLYGHTHRVECCITPTYKYGVAVDHGAWTIGHMRDIGEELANPALGVHAERHKQGFALVHHFQVGGELRFRVELIPIDRKPNGKPYAVVAGVVFE